VEVRAHDEPGLLWLVGRALGGCGLDLRSARVETLGAEAVDVFYVADEAGQPLTDKKKRQSTVEAVLAALTSLKRPVPPSIMRRLRTVARYRPSDSGAARPG
jgi:UTP:GlnB (protein PII) uridylyltransferase